MATIAENESMTGRKRPGVRGRKRYNPRTDMTPMVDLAFLLISFFIMTTEMTKPGKMDLNMPKDGPPMGTKSSTTITFLLDESQQLFWYDGETATAIKENQIHTTDYSAKGLRSIIQQKQQQLGTNREELMVLIKPMNTAAYRSIVKVLDEMFINAVKRYALVNTTDEEVKAIDHLP